MPNKPSVIQVVWMITIMVTAPKANLYVLDLFFKCFLNTTEGHMNIMNIKDMITSKY